MNETLEAMARALFKSWFVDFDPVRVKAEGRDPGLRRVGHGAAQLFGVDKPAVAMAHLPPMPGTPLYDETGGPAAIVESVARDVEHLVGAGFDAILFCNEGDRPYLLQASLEGVAMMARVVAEGAALKTLFLFDPAVTTASEWQTLEHMLVPLLLNWTASGAAPSVKVAVAALYLAQVDHGPDAVLAGRLSVDGAIESLLARPLPPDLAWDLAGVAVEKATQAKWEYIPYKGGSQAIGDTVAGQTQVLMNGMLATYPLVKGDKLKLLAVTESQRSSLLASTPRLPAI